MRGQNENLARGKQTIGRRLLAEPPDIRRKVQSRGIAPEFRAHAVIATDGKNKPRFGHLLFHQSQRIEKIAMTFIGNKIGDDGNHQRVFRDIKQLPDTFPVRGCSRRRQIDAVVDQRDLRGSLTSVDS